MYRQIILYFFCGIGLWYSASNRTYTKTRLQTDIFKKSQKARAYILGEKKRLKRNEIKAHHKLHIIHLLTPSGLHLSALLILLVPFLRKKPKLFWPCLGIIYALSGLLGNAHAFRRMLLLTGVARLRKQFDFKTLLISFLLDALFGSLYDNPLSWFMSLLFLGIIIIHIHEPKYKFFFNILIAQSIIGLVFGNLIYPIGIIIGWLVTALFPLAFPLLIVESIFPFTNFSQFMVDAIVWLSQFSGYGFLPKTILIVLTIIIFPFKKLLWVALIVWSIPLDNLPKNYQKPPPFPFSPIEKPIRAIYRPWGVKLIYSNKIICRSRLYRGGWSSHCRK